MHGQATSPFWKLWARQKPAKRNAHDKRLAINIDCCDDRINQIEWDTPVSVLCPRLLLFFFWLPFTFALSRILRNARRFERWEKIVRNRRIQSNCDRHWTNYDLASVEYITIFGYSTFQTSNDTNSIPFMLQIGVTNGEVKCLSGWKLPSSGPFTGQRLLSIWILPMQMRDLLFCYLKSVAAYNGHHKTPCFQCRLINSVFNGRHWMPLNRVAFFQVVGNTNGNKSFCIQRFFMCFFFCKRLRMLYPPSRCLGSCSHEYARTNTFVVRNLKSNRLDSRMAQCGSLELLWRTDCVIGSIRKCPIMRSDAQCGTRSHAMHIPKVNETKRQLRQLSRRDFLQWNRFTFPFQRALGFHRLCPIVQWLPPAALSGKCLFRSHLKWPVEWLVKNG